MIGIAGLVGGAIFVLTGPAIGLGGASVVIAFIINAIITLFTAMGYAELGCDTRSWWRLSVGEERITKAKCFHKWLDGMVCTYCCR
jgi:L-asparagine transporter-like permease